LVTSRPDERAEHHAHGGDQAGRDPEHLSAGLADRFLERLHRHFHVEHAENPCLLQRLVAFAPGARPLVLDHREVPQQFRPLGHQRERGVLEQRRVCDLPLGVTALTGRRIERHRLPDLLFVGRHDDRAPLVVHANRRNRRPAHEVPQRRLYDVGPIQQHAVAGRQADEVRGLAGAAPHVREEVISCRSEREGRRSGEGQTCRE
jgi:hypothetical protein